MTAKYPYLGAKTIDGKNVVVFFGEKDYGQVVVSDITDQPNLVLGHIGDFDETAFQYVDPSVVVRLNNDPTE